MTVQTQIERVYTDGACSGNPGPGGWGVVAYLANGTVHEMGGRDRRTTNNRMELQAAIAALQLLQDIQQSTPVTLYTDSEYVKKGITQWIAGWKRKKWKTSTGKAVVNLDLWQQLDELNAALKKQLSLSWEYVRGHAGDEGNERSDAIARAFSQNSSPPLHTVNALLAASPDVQDVSSEKDEAIAPAPVSSAKSGVKSDTDPQVASEAPEALYTSDPVPNPVSDRISDRVSDATSTSVLDATSAIQPTTQPTPQPMMNPDKLSELRALVETFQLADVLAEQRYLVTTHELADLVGISVTTATNRGDRWVWRNWRVSRVRQESNQILWQLERVS